MHPPGHLCGNAELVWLGQFLRQLQRQIVVCAAVLHPRRRALQTQILRTSERLTIRLERGWVDRGRCEPQRFTAHFGHGLCRGIGLFAAMALEQAHANETSTGRSRPQVDITGLEPDFAQALRQERHWRLRWTMKSCADRAPCVRRPVSGRQAGDPPEQGGAANAAPPGRPAWMGAKGKSSIWHYW